MKTIMKYDIHRIHAILPLSWQGLLLSFLLIYFLALPINSGNDVILTVVTFCIIPLLCLTLAATIFLRRRLIQHLTFKLNIAGRPEAKEPLVSQIPLNLIATVNNCRLFPFFSLELRLEWNSSITHDTTFAISSAWESRLLAANQTITFPHRGRWQIERASALLRGPLRLTRVSWQLPLPDDHFWEIGVAVPESQRLPIITSSSQPGDAFVDVNNRKGDYYDLKPYHSSDGLNRIVWKIYAKSGQLISRKPEPASDPEGRMLLFLWAQAEHDELAGICLRYLLAASDSEIAFTFGCHGMNNRVPAETYQQARSMIIDSVWNTELINPADSLQSFLEALPDRSHYERINIFCSETMLAEDANIKTIEVLGNQAKLQGLDPVFVIPKLWNVKYKEDVTHTMMELAIRSRLVTRSSQDTIYLPPPVLLSAFEDVCSRNQWKLVRS